MDAGPLLVKPEGRARATRPRVVVAAAVSVLRSRSFSSRARPALLGRAAPRRSQRVRPRAIPASPAVALNGDDGDDAVLTVTDPSDDGDDPKNASSTT